MTRPLPGPAHRAPAAAAPAVLPLGPTRGCSGSTRRRAGRGGAAARARRDAGRARSSRFRSAGTAGAGGAAGRRRRGRPSTLLRELVAGRRAGRRGAGASGGAGTGPRAPSWSAGTGRWRSGWCSGWCRPGWARCTRDRRAGPGRRPRHRSRRRRPGPGPRRRDPGCGAPGPPGRRRPDRRRARLVPDLVVLADALAPEPARLRRLHVGRHARTCRCGCATGSGVVGPLVLPGRTACLGCLDLHRGARAPGWPTVAAQLTGRRGRADPAATAATAALGVAQALAALDSTSSGGSRPPTLGDHPRAGRGGRHAAPAALGAARRAAGAGPTGWARRHRWACPTHRRRARTPGEGRQSWCELSETTGPAAPTHVRPTGPARTRRDRHPPADRGADGQAGQPPARRGRSGRGRLGPAAGRRRRGGDLGPADGQERRAAVRRARRAQGRGDEVRPGPERVRGGHPRRVRRAVPRVAGQAADRGTADVHRPTCTGCWPSSSAGAGGARFREFDEIPAAAASIGQVHRAVWRDGREVAVKLQYPGAEEALRSDLRQLSRMSRLMQPLVPGLEIKPLIAELRERMEEELDYRDEAASQRTFAAAFDGDEQVAVPRVVASAPRAMVTEWVTGRKLSDVIREGTQDERDTPRGAAGRVPLLRAGPGRAAARRPAPGQLPAARRRPADGHRLRRGGPAARRAAPAADRDDPARAAGPAGRPAAAAARRGVRAARLADSAPRTRWPTWRRSPSRCAPSRSASTGAGCRARPSGWATCAARSSTPAAS